MNLVPSGSMTYWVKPMARWVHCGADLLSDPPVARALFGDLRSNLLRDVRDRPAVMLGDITIGQYDHHGDLFTRNLRALLAEVTVLDLLTPDPFPPFILLPRLHRLGNLYRKARNAWPSRP